MPGRAISGLRRRFPITASSIAPRPLEEDLTIAGEVRVTLHVQSDCPDTDFVAKLIEVEPDGRAMLLMDGVVRAMYRDSSVSTPQHLEPDRVYRLTINLAHIHHTIRAGNRIEVDVTSSNFPRRARNTNSGNPVLANDTEADIRVATNGNITSFSDCGFPVNQPPFPSSTSTPREALASLRGRLGAASGQGSKAGAAIFMAHCLTGRRAGRYAQSSEPRPHGTSLRSAEPIGSKPDPMPRRQSPASS